MSKRNQIRLVMLVPAFILGYLIISTFYLCWTSFVLTQDSSQAQATIVNKLSHGVVQYKYNVGGQQFIGQSQPKNEVQIGAQVPVNYSPHHPSWSSLQNPTFPPSQFILLIIVLPFEFFCLATVVNPKGKWALQTGLKPNE